MEFPFVVKRMKKALIIGAGGFVGSYLIDCLHDEFHMDVYATKLKGTELSHPSAQVYDLDILSKEDLVELLYNIRPDYIFHLAAQSSVSVAWKNPMMTIDVNIKGSLHLLEALREIADQAGLPGAVQKQQQPLSPSKEKLAALDKSLDKIREKYGDSAVIRGSLLSGRSDT